MLPKIYKRFIKEKFFTIREAHDFYSNQKITIEALRQLRGRGHIRKVRRGLYELVPQEYIGENKPFADKFLLGRKVITPYHFAYHSALEIHGVASTAIYNRVYISSKNRFREFTYEDVKYIWVKNNSIGVEKVLWSNNNVFVTDREKTIIDCIQRLNYAGGFEETYRSLFSFPSINLERLKNHLSKINVKSLYNKIGFFLSLPSINEKWQIDSQFLKNIESYIGEKKYYFVKTNNEKKLVKRWNLIIPKDLEKMMFV